MSDQIDLNDIEPFLAKFETWCASQNVTTSTATNRVLGNTYAIDAIRRRREKLLNDLEAISGIMSNSPFGRRRQRSRTPKTGS